MWRPGERVTCTACGRSIRRADAREYDKYGDRWDRREKSFEHFCKPCHDDLCHRSRDGLEAVLVEAGAGQCDDAEFLRRFAAAVEGDSLEES